ncbi:MAG: hypothetical protein AAGF31_12075 [Planctomycetota bacterium]
MTYLSTHVDRLYGLVDHPKSRLWLDRVFVTLAAVGFLAHVAVIAVSRNLPDLAERLFGGLDRNYLHAVYTPFSFILFYEVLLLVLAIPRSHTSSIAKQYQIVSLIVIRRVFKDLGGFSDLDAWVNQPDVSRALLLDMVTAVAMFVATTAFERVSRLASKGADPPDLAGFVTLKRAIALLLGVVLIALAGWSAALWCSGVWTAPSSVEGTLVELDLYFFPEFFELMIFTDVFLLIVSIAFYDRYELVFRNAGFVISTVLLRASLTSPPPYNNGLGLLAMAYGVAVLAVFVWHSRAATLRAEAEKESPSD